jgi:hypothetical protein
MRPGFRDVIVDGRLANVARTLLDTDDLFYCGDSSITVNSNQFGWHKDNADRLDGDAPDWQSDYTQLRFGIYLQDHTNHSGGLNLRQGSQNYPDLVRGKCTYMRSVPGELAVWNMRITHSGNGVILKDPEADCPPPGQVDKIPMEDRAPLHENRIAIFAHLGANDAHAERYAEYLKTREYIVNMWRRQSFDQDAKDAVRNAGITLRDMPSEVANDPLAGANKGYKPLPY